MWWTAPLYAIFLFAGLYAEHFTFTATVALLLGLLVAFGLLDVIVLTRIASIRTRTIGTLSELEATRQQIERLSRMLLIGGGAFGAAFLIGVIMLVLL
ncbi:MAG: hypothetical protein AABX97_05940 [Candidatus Thermoplasmatota archaeon]